MLVNGFQNAYWSQPAKKATAYTKLVASMNTKAANDHQVSIHRFQAFDPEKALSELKKDLENYKNLNRMEAIYRGAASKRKQEASAFQELTGQRDALLEELAAERAILSDGGRTSSAKFLSWDGPLVPIEGKTLQPNVSDAQAFQPDTPLEQSDAPVGSQLTVTDSVLSDVNPTPVERSIMRIAALEQKLGNLENQINEFVDNANLSDALDWDYGFASPVTRVKSGSIIEADKQTVSRDEDAGLGETRTRENFAEKTAAAAADFEARADGCLAAMGRLYDKYKEKYNISLPLLCVSNPSLEWSSGQEQDEMLLQVLQKRSHAIERRA